MSSELFRLAEWSDYMQSDGAMMVTIMAAVGDGAGGDGGSAAGRSLSLFLLLLLSDLYRYCFSAAEGNNKKVLTFKHQENNQN